MRPLLYVLSGFAVMGLAFWAYRQNYATQASLKVVAKLQREIGQLHDDLAMQRAEWAYENRPSRLRDLAILNFDKLGLLAMTPEQFGAVSEIAMPKPLAEAPDPALTPGAAPAAAAGSGPAISNPVDTAAGPAAGRRDAKVIPSKLDSQVP